MTAKRDITAPAPRIPTTPATLAITESPLVFGSPDAAPCPPAGAGTVCTTTGGVTDAIVAGTVATIVQTPRLPSVPFVTVALKVTLLLLVADPVLTDPDVPLPVPLASPVTEIWVLSFVTSTVVALVTVQV
jgi:hypothetical protein